MGHMSDISTRVLNLLQGFDSRECVRSVCRIQPELYTVKSLSSRSKKNLYYIFMCILQSRCENINSQMCILVYIYIYIPFLRLDCFVCEYLFY